MKEGSGLDTVVAWEWRGPSDPPLVQTVMAGKGRRFKPRKQMCARESIRRNFEGGKSCHGVLES